MDLVESSTPQASHPGIETPAYKSHNENQTRTPSGPDLTACFCLSKLRACDNRNNWLSYFRSPIRFTAPRTTAGLVTEQARRSLIRTRGCISRNASEDNRLDQEAPGCNSDISSRFTVLAVTAAISKGGGRRLTLDSVVSKSGIKRAERTVKISPARRIDIDSDYLTAPIVGTCSLD